MPIATSLPILLLVGLGALCRFAGIFRRDDSQVLTKIVFYLTMPATGFLAIWRSEIPLGYWKLPIIAVCVPIILLGVAYLFSGKLNLVPTTLGVFLASATVANLGFFAYPFFFSRYGNDGLSRVAVFDVGNTLVAYTITLAIAKYFGHTLSKQMWRNLRTFLLSPPLLAVLIGIPANLIQITIPGYALHFLELLAAANIPLVMITLGIMIQPKRYQLGIVILATIVRMGLGTLFGWFLASMFGLSGLNKTIATIAAGMPVGMSILIYASNERLDQEFAANLISISALVGVLWINMLFQFMGP